MHKDNCPWKNGFEEVNLDKDEDCRLMITDKTIEYDNDHYPEHYKINFKFCPMCGERY